MPSHPKQIMKLIRKKNITTNIYKMHADDSMCAYFCIAFIDLMLKGKSQILPIYFVLTNMNKMIK